MLEAEVIATKALVCPLCTAGGDCKADGLLAPAQGSGVVIDDSATVADGVVTAIADCVEAPGTTFQVSPHGVPHQQTAAAAVCGKG